MDYNLCRKIKYNFVSGFESWMGSLETSRDSNHFFFFLRRICQSVEIKDF